MGLYRDLRHAELVEKHNVRPDGQNQTLGKRQNGEKTKATDE